MTQGNKEWTSPVHIVGRPYATTSIVSSPADQHNQNANATAVRKYHSHAIPLDMEDIERDWDKPVEEAGIAAKASIIVRVGMLDLGAGTGSFRVREMMHRIAYPLGVHVRADVNLTNIEAACTDGKNRITEVVDLPTTGVNTERIWLLEHFADWFNAHCGVGSMYHAKASVSEALMESMDAPEAQKSLVQAARQRRKQKQAELDARRIAGQTPSEGRKSPISDDVKSSNGEQAFTDTHASEAGQAPNIASNSSADQSERKPLTVRQAHDRLDVIEHRKPLYTPAFSALGAAIACAAFVFLLGGGPYDMIGAFVGAGIGHFLRRLMFARRLNQFFVTFVSVAVAALVCTGTLRLIGLADPVALQHDTAYIGAMLFVIPGFPLITGGLDIAKLDFPSGVQRMFYTLSLILMATLAAWMVALIVRLNPQGFEPLNLNPWVYAGLRFIAAFAGVWGFSVLFNSPQRMCYTAAIIGAITDTLRLTFVDFGMPPEAAAFIGALLAGLLATAWRQAVRHGKLPLYLGYPRICLTVPSIVIMVPGMYMYQAMFHLGQYEIQQSLDWGFRAFMVIVCLPIGLAMARVLTDKSWRYDV